MTAYRVTYYTLSDDINSMIIAAGTPEEAGAEARKRDDCFAQLKQVIYIGDNKPMTTPTSQPDKMTAQELRDEFAAIHTQLDQLTETLTTITQGIQHAATATPPAQGGTFETMDAVKLIRTRSKGKWYYKMQGGRYMKQGVTIWEEVLDLLDIDPLIIAWDENDAYKLPEPITVKMLIKEYSDEETGERKQTPQKVTGRA